MRVIVAGSRWVYDQKVVDEAIAASGFDVHEVVSGCASGVDRLGEEWARSRVIPVKRFQPEWNRLGRNAGPTRNTTMAAYADALVAVWDGESRGTADMIRKARMFKLDVYVHNVKKPREP